LSSSAIANQESLSGLETEMRKLEGVVKEIVDELEYLKQREERFSDTNRQSSFGFLRISYEFYVTCSCDESPRAEFCLVHHPCPRGPWRLADSPPPVVFQAQVPYRLMGT
jgi:hypothetical protein